LNFFQENFFADEKIFSPRPAEPVVSPLNAGSGTSARFILDFQSAENVAVLLFRKELLQQVGGPFHYIFETVDPLTAMVVFGVQTMRGAGGDEEFLARQGLEDFASQFEGHAAAAKHQEFVVVMAAAVGKPGAFKKIETPCDPILFECFAGHAAKRK
jgi:hypothetical protein